ncbi:hypothetical protein, partial [Scytonema sp. PCC 10023]|uniref:hypothetical protein n=1 Tax=Scytonema sp. PCC 10023 TaxID=1680591 RepID=UPI0039C638E3
MANATAECFAHAARTPNGTLRVCLRHALRLRQLPAVGKPFRSLPGGKPSLQLLSWRKAREAVTLCQLAEILS